MPFYREIHRRTYPLRVSYMALGGLVVGTSLLHLPTTTAWWAFTAISALIWPHIAFFHSSRQDNQFRAEYINSFIDALIIGCWIALMHWSLLPSICILAIGAADRFYTGLKRRWLPSLAALLCGMALMGMSIHPTPQWDTPLSVQLSLLPLIIVHSAYASWANSRMLKTLARQNLQLKLLGRIDPLTMVYSREYWWKKARTALNQYRTQKEQSSLLVIDIDRFKSVNDLHGHIVGDEALKLVGLAIRNSLRSNDIAGRYGGDEFTVLCKKANAEVAYTVALRIRDKIAQIRIRDYPQFRISASIGVAAADDEFSSVTEWVRAADSALYNAKSGGRNQVIHATTIQDTGKYHSPASMPMRPESTRIAPPLDTESKQLDSHPL